MKPMSLNLSKMKKVAGDKESSTFQHPGGHQIKIAHAPLSALQKKQIEAMPIHALADGGDVSSSVPSQEAQMQSDLDSAKSSQPGPASNPTAENIGDGYYRAPDDSASRSPASVAGDIGSALRNGISDATQAFRTVGAPIVSAGKDFIGGLTGADANAASNQDKPASSLPEPSKDLPGMGQPIAMGSKSAAARSPGSSSLQGAVDINSAYKQGQNAISEQQKVSEQMAKSQSEIEQKNIEDKQNLANEFNNNVAQFKQHQQKLMNDYMSGHIDPHHYVEKMGVPSKIASAIGMILGGAGAGAGQPNPGVEFLNNQINRDIEAQKSRLGQQKTLIEANQSLFHDDVLANNATRMNLNDIYDHQIKQAADKIGSPQARAAADAAHSQFAMQNAALLQQNAIRATVLNRLQSGGQGIDAVDLAHAGLMSPEEANKEQSSLSAQRQGIQQVKGFYNQLAKLQTAANRLANPIQSGRQIDAINADITNAIVEADASKRLTPESAKLEVMPFHVSLTDSPETVMKKAQGVLNLIKEHAAGTTPNTEKYAPASLPNYEIMPESRQHSVGEVVFVRGQKMQIVDHNGTLKPVR